MVPLRCRAAGSRRRTARTARRPSPAPTGRRSASVSKAATEAPMSPPPPYSSGKPMPVWPVPAISTHDLHDPLAELRRGEHLGLVEDRGVLGEVGADQVADLGVLAVEQRGQRGDVDVGLDVSARAMRRQLWPAHGCRASQRVTTCRSRPGAQDARRSSGGSSSTWTPPRTGRPVRGAWMICPPPT